MPKQSDSQHRARRRDILDAVFRCLVRSGYARMTTREIAKEAGISVGTLYLYFNDKEEMLTALYESLQAQQQSAVSIAPRDASPGATLSAIFDYLLAGLDDKNIEPTLRVDIQLWAEALNHETIRRFTQSAFHEKTDQFRALIVDAGPDQVHSDPSTADATARLLLALMIGLEVQRALISDYEYKQLSATTARLIEILIGKP